ncbi:MAG: PD-(D/E)XK nuclease family protein [Actinomycetota bacterium]
MPGLALSAHGPPAREALWAAIDAAKGDDPLAPVTVAAPSVYAGLSLRRLLAARRPSKISGRPGLVNVRFLPLARVAELLGAPTLAAAGRRPLTAPLRTEAARTVLAGDPGAFAAVAGHPATVRSLEASFRDLRRAPATTIRALGARPDPAATVARLFGAFQARTSSFYDEEDLAEAAAGATATGSPALEELGHLVLHLPARLSPGEGALLDALGARGRLAAVVGRTGDAADEPVGAAVLDRLGGILGPPSSTGPTPAPPAGTAVLSAPDPEDEVRAVLRSIVERAGRGVPLHRLAVLYRDADPYARLVRELFDAAEVAWSGPATRRLADSVAGRVLLGLLALADRGFRRDEVAAWMASGPVLDPNTGHAVPAARWDTLSREAGVVDGLDQWRARLDRHARACTTDLAAARGDDATPESAVLRLESDLEQVTRLAAFVDDLGARLTPPEPADWSTLTAWARDLLRVYLGGEGRRRGWPEDELDAARRVDAALDGLGVLSEIRPGTDSFTFLRAVEAELDAPLARSGTFGRGVLVGPLRHAYGGDFDTVFVLGMAEGAFPPRTRDDPVLPDRDREAVTTDALPLHTLRRAEERRDYLAALASAPERILCFPRADPRAQRKRLPARWLLESAAGLADRSIGAEELAALRNAPWLHVVPSFEGGVCGNGDGGGDPGSLGERDVRSFRRWQRAGRRLARHPLVAAEPDLGAGVRATDGRASAGLTAFDGFVGALAGLRPTPERPLSPTSLEDWAVCPFRYLLGRVLRLREVERPEDTETISPLERGSLVHAVLEEFLDTVEARTAADQPWSAAERDRLLAIGERHCDDAAAAGVTGQPLQWRLERRRILRLLRGVLGSDEEIRAELGVVPAPAGREVEFGRAGAAPLVVRLPDGRGVAFAGRIDRVDHALDGSRVVVLDYKTGHPPGNEPREELPRGTRLQLPVYALAADPGTLGTDVSAYYWHVGQPGIDGLYGYELDGDVLAEFHTVLATILDGVEGGVFPAYPGLPRGDGRGRDTWDNCCYCPYDRVCPPGRDDIWERKRDDPVAVTFRGLADPEPDEDAAS